MSFTKHSWMRSCLLSIATLTAWGALAVALAAPTTHAAEQPRRAGFAISPPLFELSANPGDTLEHSIRVDNLTDAPLPLVIDRKDFIALGEEGQAELTDTPTRYSLSSWIKPASDVIELEPKSSETITFRIEVPVLAEPGGHFGSIVFRTEPRAEGGGTVVSQQIGALVLLKVAGASKEEAEILSFSTTRSLFEGGPIEFETRFKNEGNVQTKPTGSITITSFFGRKVATIPIGSRTVLPDSVRRMTANWQGSSWPALYTATLALNYGSDNQLLTSSTRFVIFPYRIIIPLFIACIVLGVFIFRGRKRLLRSLRILIGKE